ncbi:uncharacterized protein RJT21DRAFT_122116 [Scheffersomyces amazonensis]|uniref:uncharacterized protein n=1 Tax=Scheffersomyces amazonensis TaxID=1078765 RepID=UPI00315CD104
MKLYRLILFLIQLVFVIAEDNTKYKVKYHYAEIPWNIADELVGLNNNLTSQGQFEIINIRSSTVNDKYICYIPSISSSLEEELISLPPNNISEITLNRQNLKKQAVKEISKSLSTQGCNIAFGVNGGYWTFGYCYGDKVIQFHSDIKYFVSTGNHRAEEPDFVYLLGKFPGSPSITNKTDFQNNVSNLDFKLNPQDFLLNDEINKFNDPINQLDSDTPKQTFIQHTLFDGTKCEETGNSRQIDIIYKCDPNKGMVEIADVHEINICKYQMVINIPRLCSIEEFRVNTIETKTVDIDCKLVNRFGSVSIGKPIEFQNFFDYPDKLAKNQYFPVHKDNRINTNDYIFKPLGSNLFFGFRKEKLHTESPYWNNRNILLFNGKYNTTNQLLQNIGKTYVRALDYKIPSPIVLDENKYSTLSLKDTFTVWYELYDVFGKLIGLIRIKRDRNHEDGRIVLHIINPELMTDQYGQKVIIEKFDAPNNQWNFENFYRPRKDVIEREKQMETFKPTEEQIQEQVAEALESLINSGQLGEGFEAVIVGTEADEENGEMHAVIEFQPNDEGTQQVLPMDNKPEEQQPVQQVKTEKKEQQQQAQQKEHKPEQTVNNNNNK